MGRPRHARCVRRSGQAERSKHVAEREVSPYSWGPLSICDACQRIISKNFHCRRTSHAIASRLCNSLHQRFEQANGISADGTNNRKKLYDVDAPLAAFVLGNERLMFFKPPGEIMLGKASLLAGKNHQLAEGVLLCRVDRFPYAAPASCHRRRRLILRSDYPKWGYFFTFGCLCKRAGGIARWRISARLKASIVQSAK